VPVVAEVDVWLFAGVLEEVLSKLYTADFEDHLVEELSFVVFVPEGRRDNQRPAQFYDILM